MKIHSFGKSEVDNTYINRINLLFTQKFFPENYLFSDNLMMLDNNNRNHNRYHVAKEKCKFIAEINNHIDLLKIKSHQDFSDKETGIQFPYSSTINFYKKDRSVEHFINIDRNHADEFCSEIFLQDRDSSYVITGKIGSGKTIFMRYVYTQLCIKCENGKQKKVIPCIIEYNGKRIDDDLTSLNTDEQIRSYLEDRIIDGLLFATKYIIKENLINDIEPYLINFSETFFPDIGSSDIVRLQQQFKNYFCNKQYKSTIIGIDRRIKDIIIFVIKQLGYRFIVLLDGFDIFSLDEIIEGKQKQLFSVLNSFLRGRPLRFDKFVDEEVLSITLGPVIN